MKKFDFKELSGLTKKIDLDKIVGNVKNMVNPTGQIPDVDPDDKIGVKLATLATTIQAIAQTQAEQTKQLAKVNKLFNEVYAEIEAERGAKAAAADDIVKTADEEDTDNKAV